MKVSDLNVSKLVPSETFTVAGVVVVVDQIPGRAYLKKNGEKIDLESDVIRHMDLEVIPPSHETGPDYEIGGANTEWEAWREKKEAAHERG